jgi:hypothetical protein
VKNAMHPKIVSATAGLCVIVLAAALGIAGCGGGGGGGGGNTTPPCTSDTTHPTLTVTTPSENAQVLDAAFRNESFYIQVSYSDACPMDESTLHVTFKMDDDPAMDVDQYFIFPNSTTIKSNSDFIYNFTRNLFDIHSNTQTRTMKAYVYIKDTAGNPGETTRTFIVYPDVPSGP